MNIYKHVSDEDLLRITLKVLSSVEKKLERVEKDMHSNVLDPLSAIFESGMKMTTYSEWYENEKYRQTQKTLQNAVGSFHEDIIGAMKNWDNPPKSGFDVINTEGKIIAEIKNKHNTMNAGSGESVYNTMSGFLDNEYSGYTGYVVTIIPTKSQGRFMKKFNPAGRGADFPEREDLLLVDGSTFYKIASGGDEDALKDLCEALPKVLKKVNPNSFKKEGDIKKFMELIASSIA